MIGRGVVLVGVLALAVSGCASPRPAPGSDALQRPLTVFAAASLQQVLGEIGADFEKQTGTPVAFSFGGSADLVTQIHNGAPADVLATADRRTAERAVEGGDADDTGSVFATNTLTIGVAPGNPQRITGLKDLERDGLRVVICAEQVPCGAATRQLTERSRVTLTPVSEENSVTAVLGQVAGGQADAGLVYRTDIARAGGRVEAVGVPEAEQVPNSYHVMKLKNAEQTAQADAFVAWITGDRGRQRLEQAGFGRP